MPLRLPLEMVANPRLMEPENLVGHRSVQRNNALSKRNVFSFALSRFMIVDMGDSSRTLDQVATDFLRLMQEAKELSVLSVKISRETRAAIAEGREMLRVSNRFLLYTSDAIDRAKAISGSDDHQETKLTPISASRQECRMGDNGALLE